MVSGNRDDGLIYIGKGEEVWTGLIRSPVGEASGEVGPILFGFFFFFFFWVEIKKCNFYGPPGLLVMGAVDSIIC